MKVDDFNKACKHSNVMVGWIAKILSEKSICVYFHTLIHRDYQYLRSLKII